MNKWIVELRGIGLENKGSELMAYAVREKLTELVKPKQIIIAIPFAKEYYFHPLFKKGHFYRLLEPQSTQFSFIKSLVIKTISCFPNQLLNSLHFVLPTTVQLVLDASGFAYTDQWRIFQIELLKRKVMQCKKTGRKIILLPQAFGPFEKEANRTKLKQILPQIDWIFVRDKISYQHISDLGMDLSNISMAPDFTNLVKGQVPPYFNASKHQICVIPNYRMVDMTSLDVGNQYKQFLIKVLEILIEKNYHPFILIHEKKADDVQFIQQLITQLDKEIPMIIEDDPLYIKGILTHCHLVISSRFHGLISALSHGVPSIATSWSHKYHTLLEDYDCSELMIKDLTSLDAIKQVLDLTLSEPSRGRIIARLNERANQHRQATEEMWNKVKEIGNIS
jgi:colanic acid/amylovoran biosynthesis protein